MDKKQLTPFEIEVLLHYYCKPGDIENIDSIGGKSTCSQFAMAGLLIENPAGSQYKYSGNQAALGVYVEALTSVPLPKQVWIIPSPEKQ